MTTAILSKLDRLKEILFSYQKVLVAFSGGADSALVLRVSREVLGRENVKAVIAKSPSLPDAELREARQMAREIDAELFEIETRELENPGYSQNASNRCYFCKSELYGRLVPLAQNLGFSFILNGTQLDDLGDWRPGLQAAQEYQVKSPLVEAGFRKQDVRAVSRELGLSTWSKPQAACLSSRIPYGIRVTPEKLKQVDRGEEIIKSFGFKVVRLRWFGEKAHVEVATEETSLFFQHPEIRQMVLSRLKEIGFHTVELFLPGYRSGRLNSLIPS